MRSRSNAFHRFFNIHRSRDMDHTTRGARLKSGMRPDQMAAPSSRSRGTFASAYPTGATRRRARKMSEVSVFVMA